MCILQHRVELVRVFEPQRANHCTESRCEPEWGDADSESEPKLRNQPELGAECRVLIASLTAEVQGQQRLIDRLPRTGQHDPWRQFSAVVPAWRIESQSGRTDSDTPGPPAHARVECRHDVAIVLSGRKDKSMDAKPDGDSGHRRAADNNLSIHLAIAIKPESRKPDSSSEPP